MENAAAYFQCDILCECPHRAAVGMRVEDVLVPRNRFWVRLHEKGGKQHEMPCHHNHEDYLCDCIDGLNRRNDPKDYPFRTIGHGGDKLTTTPLPQANVYAMIGKPTKLAAART